MRRSICFFSLLLACGTPDHGSTSAEGEPRGDSVPATTGGGKFDGETVPVGLGIDRKGIVYITFDDGPSRATTPSILDTLKKHQVKATFFITGENIAGNESIISREATEGHTVGNHQWKHEQAWKTLDENGFREWVVRERDRLKEIVGDDMPLYFRYPYGSMKPWQDVIVKAEGYTLGGIGWNMDSLDWDFGNDETATWKESGCPEELRQNFEGWVMDQVEKRGGGIILMHDIQKITARHLDSILTKLEDKGYRFAPLPRDPSRLQKKTPDFIGDPCSDDRDCGFAASACRKDGDGKGFCSRPCTSSCPDAPGYAGSVCLAAPDGAENLCAMSCSDQAPCANGAACRELGTAKGVTKNVCWPATQSR